MRFLDHTQRHVRVSRTPLDEWSARRTDLYLTTHNTHNRETTKPPVGFELKISAGERPQTYACDRAFTETGNLGYYTKICFEILRKTINPTTVGVLAESRSEYFQKTRQKIYSLSHRARFGVLCCVSVKGQEEACHCLHKHLWIFCNKWPSGKYMWTFLVLCPRHTRINLVVICLVKQGDITQYCFYLSTFTCYNKFPRLGASPWLLAFQFGIQKYQC